MKLELTNLKIAHKALCQCPLKDQDSCNEFEISLREKSEDEELLKAFTDSRGLPLAIVLTKADKMTKNEIANSLKKIKKDAATDAVFMTSALKRTGHTEVENYLFENWIKNS